MLYRALSIMLVNQIYNAWQANFKCENDTSIWVPRRKINVSKSRGTLSLSRTFLDLGGVWVWTSQKVALFCPFSCLSPLYLCFAYNNWGIETEHFSPWSSIFNVLNTQVSAWFWVAEERWHHIFPQWAIFSKWKCL